MTADSVNSWANGLLVASLLFGVIATYAIVVSGNVKEKGFKRELSKANADAEKAKADAANASSKAADANLRAQVIEHDNITLRNDLEKTIIEADTEKQKLAKTQIEVADARRKQAEAEKSLEDLRTKLRARSITAGQREILVQRFRQLNGARIKVVKIGEKEASEYADQIISAIKDAGIIVDLVTIGTLSPPRYGVVVSPSPPSGATSIFLDALKSSNIHYKIEPVPNQDGQFGIFIGLKPPADT